jgi:hypothetical protein
MNKLTLCLLITLAPGLFLTAHAQDAQRQTEVAARGKDIMPFDLKATTHVFTKTPDGGIQRVVAKDIADNEQTRLIREHLQAIRAQFLARDFSGPSHIHGENMPGLAQLRLAQPGQLSITYRDIAGGAELQYQSKVASLVEAVHTWFEAQLSDHGADAMEEHMHHHADMAPQ